MKILWFLLIGVIALTACQKENEEREFHEVFTSPELIITDEGVHVSSSVVLHGSSEIIDHGFVYNKGTTIMESDFYRISLGAFRGEDHFSTTIDYNLEPGKEYVIKAFVRTEKYVIYGNPVSFVSNGGKFPVISDFSPKTAYSFDTVEIKGDYFASKVSENTVWFGEIKTTPVFADDTLMRVIVPAMMKLNTFPLKITIWGKTAESKEQFCFGLPLINRIIPQKALPGQTVKLSGKGYQLISLLSLGDDAQDFNVLSDTVLSFKINEYMAKGSRTINLRQLDRVVASKEKLEIIYPEITGFSPKIAWIDTVLTVRGSNLNRLNDFWISTAVPDVLLKTDTLLKLRINRVFSSDYVKGRFYGKTISSQEEVLFNPPVITAVSKNMVTYGETILLKGERFFKELTCPLGTFEYISRNEAELTLDWRNTAGTYPIILSYNASYSGPLSVTIPQIEITDISPYEISRGKEITITGKNFPSVEGGNYMAIALDRKPVKVTSMSNQTITALVEDHLEVSANPEFLMVMGPQTITRPNAFHMNEKWQKISNLTDFYGSTVFVLVDGKPYACTFDTDRGVIRAFNPTLEQWVYFGQVSVKSFFANMGWSIGSDVYFGYYDAYSKTASFYKYSLSGQTFSRIKGFPENIWSYSIPFSFVIDGKAYAGNKNGLFQYDAVNDNWIKKTDLPTSGADFVYPLAFSAEGKGFVSFKEVTSFGNAATDLWEYDASSNTWRNIGSTPVTEYRNGTAASFNGKIYLSGKTFYSGDWFGEFDPVNHNYKPMLRAPYWIADDSFSFIMNNYFYFLGDGDYETWMYKVPVSEFPELHK
jgi:hypothetical protein